MNIKQRKALVRCLNGLNAMKEHDDAEGCHSKAEDLLCDLLREIGFGDAADAFEEANDRVGFWYA